jgi:aryl-alcohol dehydrogenase-like predicted oxidoreductase
LGRGFLTGQITKIDDLDADDWRRKGPRFQGQNFQRNLNLVKKVKDLADAKGCTPAQLALAWVLAQGEDIVPIPGTKRRKYLEENVGALDVILTPEDLAQLDRILPPGAASGSRYPEPAMKALNR